MPLVVYIPISSAPIAAPPAAAATVVVGNAVVRRVALRHIPITGPCAGTGEKGIQLKAAIIQRSSLVNNPTDSRYLKTSYISLVYFI